MVRADDANTDKYTTSDLLRYVEIARCYQPRAGAGGIELVYECDADLNSADDKPAIVNDHDRDQDTHDDEARA